MQSEMLTDRCSLINGSLLSPQMHTPANTPATPPNFPDALAMFSRLKASESFNGSSPIASMATSPPQVNWAMGPSAPGQTQQGLWTSGQIPSQVPPPGWPQAVTQQASSEQASVAMEAERWEHCRGLAITRGTNIGQSSLTKWEMNWLQGKAENQAMLWTCTEDRKEELWA